MALISFANILPPPIKRVFWQSPQSKEKGKNDPNKGKRNNTVRCSKCKDVGRNARSFRRGSTIKQKKASTVIAAGAGDSGAGTSAGPSGTKRKIASRVSSSKGVNKGKKK